jgi:hypothetical protein
VAPGSDDDAPGPAPAGATPEDLHIRLTRLEDAVAALQDSIDSLVGGGQSGGHYAACYTIVIRPDRLCRPADQLPPGGIIRPDRLCRPMGSTQGAGGDDEEDPGTGGVIRPDRLCRPAG